MSTCDQCGEYFRPKYKNLKLCYSCWKKRETAFREYDSLLNELSELRTIIRGSKPDSHSETIPAKRVRQLLGLCHPDRHNDTPREATANEVTQWLNKMKR